MKKEVKGFIMGVVLTALLMGTVVFADGVTRTIEVVLNSVKLTVNGQKVAADTILYNGTTYVPLRTTAEMLGKEVGWDSTTNTASINDKGVVSPPVVEKPVSNTPANNTNETVSQKNAVKMANNYIGMMAFSRDGLIKQLEFEGFSNTDASYGVNQLNVNWREQAVKMAKNYLNMMPFSAEGLIQQLEFEGFSNADAVYAVNQVGL